MKNNEIKRILVPVDFTKTSDIAVTQAITLARLIKADLYLLHVVEYNGYYFSVVPETQTLLPSLLDLEKAVEKKMEEIRKSIKSKFGIKPLIHVTAGNIYSEIIDFSKKKKIDLIIMGTHGASGYKELFVGSNAQRIVTLSTVPVLTMQNKKSKSEFKNILIPIDNSLHSREKVNLAIQIAKLFGAKIHILGLEVSNDGSGVREIEVRTASVEKIITAEKLSYKTTIVSKGNLSKAAMKYATENKCDLIVINTGHESKSSGIFLGTFAQQIVNHSTIPVLSFRHSEGHYDINTEGFGIG